MKRIAIVLFNLGGPDSLNAVRPFLINLFSDPAILRVPGVLRWGLARWIAVRRTPIAREIYRKLGGSSPILAETLAQARALETALAETGVVRVFVAMRYWHPRAVETARAVREFGPDQIVLLPLYPQFSTTTTMSSLGEWTKRAAEHGLSASQREIRGFPVQAGFVGALANGIARAFEGAGDGKRLRVLFSAHGLPQSIIAAGDPYQSEVELSVAAIVEKLGRKDLDWAICYQSRVGPLKWLEPSLEDELRRAAADRIGVIIVPVAFVSEHSETLVELDIDYRGLAERLNLPAYIRVPTVGTDRDFIMGLASLIRQTLIED